VDYLTEEDINSAFVDKSISEYNTLRTLFEWLVNPNNVFSPNTIKTNTENMQNILDNSGNFEDFISNDSTPHICSIVRSRTKDPPRDFTWWILFDQNPVNIKKKVILKRHYISLENFIKFRPLLSTWLIKSTVLNLLTYTLFCENTLNKQIDYYKNLCFLIRSYSLYMLEIVQDDDDLHGFMMRPFFYSQPLYIRTRFTLNQKEEISLFKSFRETLIDRYDVPYQRRLQITRFLSNYEVEERKKFLLFNSKVKYLLSLKVYFRKKI
jgi:hypothetical protein